MRKLTLLLTISLSSCMPQQQVVLRDLDEIKRAVLSISKEQSEIRSDIAKLDERYRTEQITLNQYEKSKIQTRIDSTDVDELFEYLRSLLSAEKNVPVKRN